MKNNEDFTSKYNLVKKLATTNMHLYSSEGRIKKYKNVKEIMKEFYDYRLMMYVKRKEYMLNCLKEQLELLSNKVRFILMKLEGKIVIENKKKVVLVKCLEDFKFPLVDDKYDYLLGMPLWNLTYEKVNELKKQMKDKEKEYKTLNKKSAENIWLEELNILKDKYIKWIK
jgi:DNA topoisomerase-2